MRTLYDITKLDQRPGESLYVGNDLVTAYHAARKASLTMGGLKMEPPAYAPIFSDVSVWPSYTNRSSLLQYPGLQTVRDTGHKLTRARQRDTSSSIVADTSYGILSGLKAVEWDVVSWPLKSGTSEYIVARQGILKARERLLSAVVESRLQSSWAALWPFPWAWPGANRRPGRPPRKFEGDWKPHCPRLLARMLTAEDLVRALTSTALGWIERESAWLAKMPQGYTPVLTACPPNVPYHQNPPKYWGRVGNPLVILRELWTYGWQWFLPAMLEDRRVDVGLALTPDAWLEDLKILLAGPDAEMPLDPPYDLLKAMERPERHAFAAVYAAASVVLWHSAAVRFARNQGLGPCLGGLVLPALPDWLEGPLDELECPPKLRQILFEAEARTAERGTRSAE